jgi:glycosyltransferase involved in cell wall biosynthesis
LKIYEILASGRPLVATRIPAHTQILNEEVCFLAEARPETFAATMLRALDDPRRRATVARAARALYESRYSRQAYVGKIRSLVESLC